MGFKLTAEDIYSVNRACLKDAIVHFGGGCTGEVISAEGLLLTNHHCGYDQIQAHSSVEHDYLKDGFWARTRAEELPNEGLTVTFMRRMEDVTQQVLEGVTDTMDEKERQTIIDNNIQRISERTLQGLDKRFNTVRINATYYGNQYFLYLNEIYRDVRLVGAPPSSIGKFGGDTDNWIWPRHTGDFSLFRIYAGKDNQPAEYSPDNVPYQPKYHFTISAKGVQEGDFTMVYGYPGRTQQYVLSPAVEYLALRSNPQKIHLRTLRLEVMNREQAKDQAVRIQYASKNASVSNAWKKWQGESRGILNAGTIAKKQAFEERFLQWAENTGRQEYITLVPRMKELYEQLEPLQFASEMYTEAILAVELLRFADNLERQVARRAPGRPPLAQAFFKDYYRPIDREIFEILFAEFHTALQPTPHLLPSAASAAAAPAAPTAAAPPKQHLVLHQQRPQLQHQQLQQCPRLRQLTRQPPPLKKSGHSPGASFPPRLSWTNNKPWKFWLWTRLRHWNSSAGRSLPAGPPVCRKTGTTSSRKSQKSTAGLTCSTARGCRPSWNLTKTGFSTPMPIPPCVLLSEPSQAIAR